MTIQYSLPIDGEENKPPIGNKRLVDYGIHDENSDYRMHVGYDYGAVFVFKTKDGRSACKDAAVKSAYTGDIETARGYIVKILSIPGIKEYRIPQEILSKFRIYKNSTTTEKGLRATQIVTRMLKDGLIALPLQSDIVEHPGLQIAGCDLLTWGKYKIQVKCDLPAGTGRGFTGNLFLQFAECNPTGRH